MTRVTTLALLLGLAGTSYAQSEAEIASKLNDEGKELMYANNYSEASKKFQQAVARVPELKYFFNLCTSRFQEGKFDEALTACDAVTKGNATPELRTKTEKLVGKIMDEAKAQHIEVHPGGGGGGDPGVDPNANPADPNANPTNPTNPNPTNPNPTNPNPNPNANTAHYQPAVGRPPSGAGIFVATKPDNKYTWTLGVDLFGVGGQIGQKDAFGNAGGGIRIKSDYLLNPAARFGAQGYFQISHYGQGKDQMSAIGVQQLDIFDVGAALYKHICLGSTPRLCITPLGGVQLALMSPNNNTDGAGSQVFNYAAVGARGEVSIAYAFGSRYEHVLQVMGGFNLYSKVLSGPSADDPSNAGTPEEVGLDKGGIAGYLGLGYTYRFNTPLGSSPFVTLE